MMTQINGITNRELIVAQIELAQLSQMSIALRQTADSTSNSSLAQTVSLRLKAHFSSPCIEPMLDGN